MRFSYPLRYPAFMLIQIIRKGLFMKIYLHCAGLFLLQSCLLANPVETQDLQKRDIFSWFGGEIIQFLTGNENSVEEQITHFLENRIHIINIVEFYMTHKDTLHALVGQKSSSLQVNKKSESQFPTKGFTDLASFYLENRNTIQRAVEYFAQDKEKIESALDFFKQNEIKLRSLIQKSNTPEELLQITSKNNDLNHAIIPDSTSRSFSNIVSLFSENQSEIESGVKFFEERESDMIAAVNFFYENKNILITKLG